MDCCCCSETYVITSYSIHYTKLYEFNSRFGRLVKDEFAEYLKESNESKRNYPAEGGRSGFAKNEAIEEAKRCLHCDCRAIDDCKLRTYSDNYQADQKRYLTSERRNIKKTMKHSYNFV